MPNGMTYIPFGGSGDDKGTVVVKGKGIAEPLTVENVVVPFPTTQKAMQDLVADASFKVTDADGNEVEFSGVHALAASKLIHGYESIRGAARTRMQDENQDDPTADEVREWFRAGEAPSNGRSVETPLRDDEIDEIAGALADANGWDLLEAYKKIATMRPSEARRAIA